MRVTAVSLALVMVMVPFQAEATSTQAPTSTAAPTTTATPITAAVSTTDVATASEATTVAPTGTVTTVASTTEATTLAPTLDDESVTGATTLAATAADTTAATTGTGAATFALTTDAGVTFIPKTQAPGNECVVNADCNNPVRPDGSIGFGFPFCVNGNCRACSDPKDGPVACASGKPPGLDGSGAPTDAPSTSADDATLEGGSTVAGGDKSVKGVNQDGVSGGVSMGVRQAVFAAVFVGLVAM